MICSRQSLLVILFFLASFNVYAQQEIATDAYAIFEQSCLICHGADGAYRETLLIEHNALIEQGSVVPGNPSASELYKRLITTEAAKRMPLGQPQLPARSIETIQNWILGGAPDWAITSTPAGDFISHSEVLNTIESHLTSLDPFDRAFARYFTMTHLRNAGESAQILREYRKALYKLINSLSWGATVINPKPIDPHGTIFYIDLRHYEWDRNDGWGLIETEYPYHIAFNAPAQTALQAQLGRLQTEMKCDIPAIHVDWFIANASLPPLYHNLLSLPLTDRELETRLEVDVLQNLLSAPGVRVWRAGTNNSGVSTNNRVIERHTSRYGAYWKSYDFAGSVGTQNIFTHPLSFTADGGEVVFNLPNGLQGYYITNATGFRLDDAPINIVSNPAASDPTVRNGLSCFGCHTEGMKTFDDEVRSVIADDATPAYDKAQVLRLYVPQAEIDALVQEDMERYRGALEKTGGRVDDIEPISRFHETFQGSVDAAYAAAVVGLDKATFLAKVRENEGLQNAGLLVLDSPNGRMKRDTWTDSFDAIIFALDFPDSIAPPTDTTPSGVVHIPDRNLHIAIAEALGKSPNAPITVEEIERLGRLDVKSRGIQDLTGLQFATNLNELDLDNNQIADFSPVAGLINLRNIRFQHNPVSDLSPLRGLRNLTVISGTGSKVSDLSPIAGLIQLENVDIDHVDNHTPHGTQWLAKLVNLTFLAFDGADDLTLLTNLPKLERIFLSSSEVRDLTPLVELSNLDTIHMSGRYISDLSPLAQLPKMRHIYLPGGEISDLTPLAELTELEEIYLHHNENISDLSPLTKLTKLRELNLRDTNISDLTPLAGLTSLRVLWVSGCKISDISPLAGLITLEGADLGDNQISDISPLAKLTNLKWLEVHENNISDFSPLDELRKNIRFVWHDNPAFPKGGPQIEGPWLWTIVPTGGRRGSDAAGSGIDFLAQTSGGEVTELKVATVGANEGSPVGDSLWRADKISTAENNINIMVNATGLGTGDIDHHVAYGSVTLNAPREQETMMFVGSNDAVKVWLNGQLVHNNPIDRSVSGYADIFPVTLKMGINILLVAVYEGEGTWSGFFGFEPGTEYTVANVGVSYALSLTPIHVSDTFTLDIGAENVFDMAGWQFDIAFDKNALEAFNVSEGDFLKQNGANTFFQGGSINNGTGKITGLNAVRLAASGVSGSGTVVQVSFKAKRGGETAVELQNFQFATITGDSIPVVPYEITISIEGQLAAGDVNRDGQVTVADLILVAAQLGKQVPAGTAEDVNGDGVVDMADLLLVAQATEPAAAPAAGDKIDAVMVEGWIAQARLEDDGSLAFRQGIENLEALLRSLIPKETALLRNFPNPFNPETWIPYRLAHAADVQLTIYDTYGAVVRQLDIGHQLAGYYTDRTKAVYWDGRNQWGERVGSGVYFYRLHAGDYSQTRKLVILK